jgi:hypothetical protein
MQHCFGDNATATGIAQITPPLQGRGRGWGLSALRKAVDPTPTPRSLSDQSGGLVPPRLNGRSLTSQYATQQDYFRDKAIVTAMPKFTNLYAKRDISVNLPQLWGVGLPGRKAGVGFNTFKEPVAQQLGA